MTRRTIATFTVFGCMVLGAVVLVLVLQISDSNRAAKERADNLRRIETLGALTCERSVRQNKGTENVELGNEISTRGFVTISAECQRFVDLLRVDLLYEQGRVEIKPSDE